MDASSDIQKSKEQVKIRIKHHQKLDGNPEFNDASILPV